ncbi:MAG: hypothetical protein Q8Q40_15600 [Methylococcaceae bacterium]|nr:hypothetical protein [Methylococcaceae bacterium]
MTPKNRVQERIAKLLTAVTQFRFKNYCVARDDFLNRVLAPEGEILSFARPKESIQRKGRPDTACFLRAAATIGGCQIGLLPHLATHGILALAVPLWAIPDGNDSARRVTREFWLRCA